VFIEKEGFTEILKDAGIDKKHDIALMSTKGLPVKAACDLAQELEDNGVKIYVLHDFDLAGFKIVKTLREGTRMAEGTDVVELGLRMEDIAGLESEPVEYSQRKDPREYLEECARHPKSRSFWLRGNYGKAGSAGASR
jgi:DNA topoisomerase VI subunit A